MTQKQPTRRRGGRKRRAAVWVVVCAVLGLVTTVGVACWGALRYHERWGYPATDGLAFALPAVSPNDDFAADYRVVAGPGYCHKGWRIVASEGVGRRPAFLHDPQSVMSRAKGWGTISLSAVPADRPTGVSRLKSASRRPLNTLSIEELGVGAPMIALFSTSRDDNGYRSHQGAWIIGSSLNTDSVLRDEVLPLRPVWKGLIVDVLFWGGCWAVLFMAVRLGLRKTRRRFYSARSLFRTRTDEATA